MPAEARRVHGELTALGAELRQPLLEHLAVGWQGVFAQLAGDVDEAESFAERSYALADRAQVGYASSYLSGMLFTLRRQQGRVDELLPAMEALVAGRSASHAWQAALALAQVQTGATAAGRGHYEPLVADRARAIPRDWYWFFTVVLLAEACCSLRDRERAQELYDLLAPFAERYVQVIFAANWGSLQRHLGMLAAVLERFDVAERHLQAGIAANERIGAILMTAETQCEYGALLRARGAPGDAGRAAGLAASIDAVAAPRGLAHLRRRAAGLTEGAPT